MSELKPKNPGEAIKVAKAFLKKRDRNLVANAERAKKVRTMRKQRKARPQLIKTISADKLAKKCRRIQLDRKHVTVSKVKGAINRSIPEDAKVLLVIRNSRVPELHTVRQALAGLRLGTHARRATLIATTPANIEHIRMADGYLFYGAPSRQAISTLVHKKAYTAYPPAEGLEEEEPVDEEALAAMTEHKRAKVARKAAARKERSAAEATKTRHGPLNTNTLVEEKLGEHGLVCVEDVVDVLAKGRDAGELFDIAAKALCVFQLNDERKIDGNLARTSRPSRGLQPNIDTILNRIV